MRISAHADPDAELLYTSNHDVYYHFRSNGLCDPSKTKKYAELKPSGSSDSTFKESSGQSVKSKNVEKHSSKKTSNPALI